MFQRTKICSGVLIALGGIASLAPPALAQEATDQSGQSVQRVEITGSSIKRVQSETSLPVQTVTREDIAVMGVTTTEEFLAQLPANSMVGGVNTAQNAGLATYGESNASLRGIGANKTLILVNGHRLAPYATDTSGAVDVNTIPLAMVDRVEVLTDGASGVYGSDAIAGVINFIMRKDFKGVQLNAYYGMPTEKGGGKSANGSIVMGFGDINTDHISIEGSLDMSHDQAIYGRQRKYADHAWDPNGSFDMSATPSGNVISYFPGPTPGSPLASLGKTLFHPGNPTTAGGPDTCAATGSEFDPNFGTCRYNPSPLVPLLPDVTRINAAANLHARINDDNDFFMEGFIANTKTTLSEQPSPYNNSFLSTDLAFKAKGIDPAIVVDPSNPHYPMAQLVAYDAANGTSFAGKDIAVSLRAFDGGGRVHEDNATTYHLATGFQGAFKGWDYDAVYSHNANVVKESTLEGYQLQTELVGLLSHNPDFNPFVANQDPTLAAEIKGTNYDGPIITSTMTTDAVDAKTSGPVFKLPGGDAQAAVGVGWRREDLNLAPSAAYQSGDVSGYGGAVLPFQTARDMRAIFGEIDMPFVKSFSTDISVRYDHYPTASDTTPKISARWVPIQQVLFRGSWGEGFRVPTLPELYTPLATGTSALVKDPVTGTAAQFPLRTGGNPDLVPEKSKQFSLGTVLEPVPDLSASFDYWHIKVNNLVTTLDTQFIINQAAAGIAPYTGLVVRDAGGNISQITSININAGNLKTDGVDVDVKYKLKSNVGQWGLELKGTYTHEFNETLPDGTAQENAVGKTIDQNGNPLNAVALGGIIFKWRHALTGSWGSGPYFLALTQNYQTSYDDSARFDCSTDIECATPQHVGSFQTWDIQGAYTGVKNLTLRLGMKNMFDRQPPRVTSLGIYFQTGYDPTYYDPHGRFWYTSASYTF
jgi:iron complex outermembrane receptor protein